MSHKAYQCGESMDMISNYMITNYMNCLLKAATPLRVSSRWQWQAAVNFDVSPYQTISVMTAILGTTIAFKMKDGQYEFQLLCLGAL